MKNTAAVIVGLLVLAVLVVGFVVAARDRMAVAVEEARADAARWQAQREEARAEAVEAREGERTERARIRTGLLAEVLTTLERIWVQIWAAVERSWLVLLVVGIAYGAWRAGLMVEWRGNQRSAVSHQREVVSGQPSAVSGQPSAVSGQRSVVSDQPSGVRAHDEGVDRG